MSYRREHRGSRSSLFDGLEEGGLSASSSYSHETNDHDNERAVESLQDRVLLLKRVTGDIHEEVESHNRMLDRMEPWIDSRWYLRRNLTGECVLLLCALWFPS
ncbi:hypothetical protein ACB098_02G079600 [Castanea mollissima]